MKHKSKEFVDRPDNIAYLTLEEHIKAHKWLFMLLQDESSEFAYNAMMNGKFVFGGHDVGVFAGDKNPMYGRKHTDDAKEKQRLARLGKSPTNKGIPMTSEQREKISLSLIGKVIGNQNAKGMTYTHSEEAKKAISDANKGKVISTSQRMKQSISRSGKCIGSENVMADPINREKVRLSKIGTKKMVHASLPPRMVNPKSEQWGF